MLQIILTIAWRLQQSKIRSASKKNSEGSGNLHVGGRGTRPLQITSSNRRLVVEWRKRDVFAARMYYRMAPVQLIIRLTHHFTEKFVCDHLLVPNTDLPTIIQPPFQSIRLNTRHAAICE